MAEKRPKSESPKPLVPILRVRLREDKKGEFPVEETPSNPAHPDCPVCLQPSIHPVKIPCGHIFCFLCVKGASNQSQRCALCRQAIPPSFFDNPTLLNDFVEALPPTAIEKDRYAWFYEGRNGWWQYDERTNYEIEDGYRSKKRSFELLIAGYMYIIDLDNMSQMRRSDPSRRRRIKRDLMTAPKKGIAGLKFAQGEEEEEGATGVGDPLDSISLPSSSIHNNDSDWAVIHESPVQSPDTLSPELPGDHLSEGLQSLSLVSAQEVLVNSEEGQEEANDNDEVIEV